MFENLDEVDNASLARENLAQVYWNTDRQAKSIEILEQVLKFRSDRRGEHHPETLRAILRLATNKMYSGDTTGGIGDFRLLLDATRSKYGPRHEKNGKCHDKFGYSLIKFG